MSDRLPEIEARAAGTHTEADVSWLIAELKAVRAGKAALVKHLNNMCARPNGVCLEKVWTDE